MNGQIATSDLRILCKVFNPSFYFLLIEVHFRFTAAKMNRRAFKLLCEYLFTDIIGYFDMN